MTVAPAGWYPDPHRTPHQTDHLRYWDGTTWTGHVVQTQTKPPTDPTGIAAIATVGASFLLLAFTGVFALATTFAGLLIGIVAVREARKEHRSALLGWVAAGAATALFLLFLTGMAVLTALFFLFSGMETITDPTGTLSA